MGETSFQNKAEAHSRKMVVIGSPRRMTVLWTHGGLGHTDMRTKLCAMETQGVTGVSRQPGVRAQDRNCLCLEVWGPRWNTQEGALFSPAWAWTQVTLCWRIS